MRLPTVGAGVLLPAATRADLPPLIAAGPPPGWGTRSKEECEQRADEANKRTGRASLTVRRRQAGG